MVESEEKNEVLGRKKVDESWKQDVQKEKGKLEEEGPEKEPLPEGDFNSFISGLGMQALMFMGEIPDPITGEKQKNVNQAKYIIDTLIMLREKTKGNLSKEEERLLNGMLHELQIKYVKAAEGI